MRWPPRLDRRDYRTFAPPEAKFADLLEYLREFGLKLPAFGVVKPLDFAQLLRQVRERPDAPLIESVLLRFFRTLRRVCGADPPTAAPLTLARLRKIARSAGELRVYALAIAHVERGDRRCEMRPAWLARCCR